MCPSPFQVGLGPARAEVGLGFRRFRPPLLRWSWSVSVGLRFFLLLAFSGFARSGPGVLVFVFSLSLFFCVPLFASWLSNFHFLFMFISLSLSLHLPRCCGACVCVYHLYRCKTSMTCRGATAHLPMLPNEATEDVVDGFMDA